MKKLTIKKLSYREYDIYLESVRIGSIIYMETGLSWGGYEWVAYSTNGDNLGIANNKQECIEYFL